MLGLQEALKFQLDEILQALPGYSYCGVAREDGREHGEHAAILYRQDRFRILRTDTVWFSDQPYQPGSSTWGNVNTRIFTWAFFEDLPTRKFFYHYNLHIDHENGSSRHRSIKMLLSQIRDRATDDPVLVTGDFNVGTDNDVIELMRAADFRDAHHDFPTYSGFEELSGPKIDYIFVDPSWQVHAAGTMGEKINGRWPSDHIGLTADLVLR